LNIGPFRGSYFRCISIGTGYIDKYLATCIANNGMDIRVVFKTTTAL